MVRSATTALFISLLVHGLIAAALIVYFECAPQSDASASLDLTRVELSFAEQVEETAGASPVIPSAGRLVHKPPQNEKPPEVKPEGAQPPDPPALIFPEPFEATALAAPRQARIDAGAHTDAAVRALQCFGNKAEFLQGLAIYILSRVK